MFEEILYIQRRDGRALDVCEHRIRDLATEQGAAIAAWYCGRLRARGFAPLSHEFAFHDADTDGVDNDGTLGMHYRVTSVHVRLADLEEGGFIGDQLLIAAALDGASSAAGAAKYEWNVQDEVRRIADDRVPAATLARWMSRHTSGVERAARYLEHAGEAT